MLSFEIEIRLSVKVLYELVDVTDKYISELNALASLANDNGVQHPGERDRSLFIFALLVCFSC